MDSFDAWWQLPITWLEPPNLERGGWSGVGRWQMPVNHSEPCLVYVKKQQNHTRFSWRYLLSGQPTFMVEYQMLTRLKQHAVLVPEVVFFAARESKAGPQAVLVTKALQGFVAFDAYCQTDQIASNTGLLHAVGQAVRRLHQTGIQHRALYPKHIFVRENRGMYEVAFIDLEKARQMCLPALQCYHDLKQFLRRVSHWPEAVHYQFYQAYSADRHPILKALGWWWLQRDLNRSNKR